MSIANITANENSSSCIDPFRKNIIASPQKNIPSAYSFSECKAK